MLPSASKAYACKRCSVTKACLESCCTLEQVAQASGEHEQLDSVKHDARDAGTITNTSVRTHVQLSRHAFAAEQRLYLISFDADWNIKSIQQHSTAHYVKPANYQTDLANNVSNIMRSVLPYPVSKTTSLCMRPAETYRVMTSSHERMASNMSGALNNAFVR
ncbi:hypothetical protein DPMN_081729 [Dreissena polymorpha]|uniref:Uncharacterized protein n=1 Tax=Dreissena polymorpha TaxID=45954 RepID=A0A9D3Y960_DREPO|nr:hypothetical protein DPMN_081729 [Dreissena polymorpha]